MRNESNRLVKDRRGVTFKHFRSAPLSAVTAELSRSPRNYSRFPCLIGPYKQRPVLRQSRARDMGANLFISQVSKPGTVSPKFGNFETDHRRTVSKIFSITCVTMSLIFLIGVLATTRAHHLPTADGVSPHCSRGRSTIHFTFSRK